jgi:hypothetical protein
MPHGSSAFRAFGFHRVALFAILPLRDAEFVRLSAALGALAIGFRIDIGALLRRAASRAFGGMVRGGAVSVFHNSSAERWNTIGPEATVRGPLQKISLQCADQFGHRYHQLSPQIADSFARTQINRRTHHALVTARERDAFVHVAQFAEEASNVLRTPARVPNGFERGAFRDFARLGALQQPAFERAASSGAIGIDAAKISFEADARLGNAWHAAAAFQRDVEFSKARGIVFRLQAHIHEKDAVAAERALRTKTGNEIGSHAAARILLGASAYNLSGRFRRKKSETKKSSRNIAATIIEIPAATRAVSHRTSARTAIVRNKPESSRMRTSCVEVPSFGRDCNRRS